MDSPDDLIKYLVENNLLENRNDPLLDMLLGNPTQRAFEMELPINGFPIQENDKYPEHKNITSQAITWTRREVMIKARQQGYSKEVIDLQEVIRAKLMPHWVTQMMQSPVSSFDPEAIRQLAYGLNPPAKPQLPEGVAEFDIYLEEAPARIVPKSGDIEIG